MDEQNTNNLPAQITIDVLLQVYFTSWYVIELRFSKQDTLLSDRGKMLLHNELYE